MGNVTNHLGFISGINGSIIKVKGLEKQVRLHDLLKIVDKNIITEVIQIHSTYVVAQSFENTINLKLKDKVMSLGIPLSMELGPGLLSNVFDGIQRPLGPIFELNKSGHLECGIEFQSLSRQEKWQFIPLKSANDIVNGGDVIGAVKETESILHKIMVPNDITGTLTFIAKEGKYTIEEEIYRVKTEGQEKNFTMMQKWGITNIRPFLKRLRPSKPLITGTRFIDLLFPIAQGGTVAVPGGFGTGKSIILQTIAKYCNADIIVYVCCGEPGNEIANILKQFSETKDPKTNRAISEHIIVIANTSNMPVSAREASLFSGVTIAEYYRDMGYDVALFADSTTRWAEALREISSRLEEMPAEEGYPAYLFSKLSSFYERAGLVECLKSIEDQEQRTGSITIITSLSPPAGDFNEPVTASTKRVIQELLVLDRELSYLKNFPAINWLHSYSIYPEYVEKWWKENDLLWEDVPYDWMECRNFVNNILSKEHNLQDVKQILGMEGITEDMKLDLFMAKLIRNALLNQNAFDEIDCFSSAIKLLSLVKLIPLFYDKAMRYLSNPDTEGFIDNRVYDVVFKQLTHLAKSVSNEDFAEMEAIKQRIHNIFEGDVEEWITK